ncbi:MAG: hypothetical protein QHC78_09050 [Pigmentiphaga sp.]|uniref:hypothetical protein n=1 Tax=Pigmentiphaga sp. TaxID=1977564 RepID=UPI0029BCD643|nr:hypothetical protein [Pigmentiphaga sp.]MDX3905821.1 hypothetical protein [Pigmentiphaga sp.]
MEAITGHSQVPGLSAGVRIGPYEIRRELRRTPVQVEYLAFDTQRQSPALLREYFPAALARRSNTDGAILPPESQGDAWQAGLRAFADEAEWMAHLHHPALLGVLDVIHRNGTVYAASPAPAAVPLKPAGGCGADELKALLEPLLGALQAVHRAGHYHGAVAFSHLMRLADGQPLLLPGDAAARALAASLDDYPAPWEDGYAALEQYLDDPATRPGPSADIYGLGALAYEAVTGKRPPAAPRRSIADEYEPLTRQPAGNHPATVLAAIDAALALWPSDRPASIETWTDMLQMRPQAAHATAPLEPAAAVAPMAAAAGVDALAGQPVEAPASRPPSEAPLSAKETPSRRVSPWYAAIVAVVLAAALGWLLGREWGPAPQAPSPAATPELAATPEHAAQPAEPEPELPAPQLAGPELAAPEVPTPPAVAHEETGTTQPASEPSALPVTPESVALPEAAPPMAPPPAPPTPAVPAATMPDHDAAPPPAAMAPAAPPVPAPADTQPVRVQLKISPWGEVVVDGQSRGPSPPLRELSLPPGKHRIVVRNADLPPYETTLTIQPGKPASIEHQF